MAQERIVVGKKRSGRDAWLYRNAALSFLRMVEDRMPLNQHELTDAGRTRAEQKQIYNTWRSQLHLPVSQRIYKATAAKPGTSKHESGRAIDVSGAMRDWIRTYGHRYGWMKDRVRNEPWHMEYDWTRDQHIGRGDPREKQAEKAEEGLSDMDIKTILDRLTTIRTTQVGHTNTMAYLKGALDGIVEYLPVISNRATEGRNNARKAVATGEAIIEALSAVGVDVTAIKERADAIYDNLASQPEPTPVKVRVIVEQDTDSSDETV